MRLRKTVVNFVLKGIFNLICKIDNQEYIEALKNNKPSIVMFNHINFAEVVILITHSYPIKVTGLAKAETWKNPFFAFLFNTYQAVPIDRNGAFSGSFKKVREAIENGFYMCVAPEGTRSRNGVLQKGKPGIIQLAIDADVPILPVGHYGGERIWENLRRLRRTPIHIRAGRPFRISIKDRPGREEREEILLEVMGQMARLLPEQMRGMYSQHEYLQRCFRQSECKYLDFL